jgi:imidazolonepropionase-like amidohydrolase
MDHADTPLRATVVALALLLGCLGAIGGVGAGAAGTAPAPDRLPGPVRAFVGARILDGTDRPAIDDGVILVRGGRIESIGPRREVSIPPEAERVDLAGKTVLPGLINTHGHVGDTRGLTSDPAFYTRDNLLDQLGRYARYGVTTVFSLGGDGEAGFALRDEQATPTLDRARIFVAGPVVTAETPEAARREVDRLATRRADLVKIRVDDNLGTTKKMPEPVFRAVIDQAHRRGLRVAAHIFYLDDAKALLRAGVDFIAHSVRDRLVDEEFIALMRERNICYSPTLMREVSTFVYESTPDFFADPFFLREIDRAVLDALTDPDRQQRVRESRSARAYKQALDVARLNVKRLAEAGVRIAMGTDTGPPARFQGYFEHLELEQLVEAGLTPAQALAAATREAARCMRVSDQIGTLERGRWADFLVLGADPRQDIRATRRLESVWIAGNRVPPRAPATGLAP